MKDVYKRESAALNITRGFTVNREISSIINQSFVTLMKVPEFLELIEKLGFPKIHFSLHLENEPKSGLAIQSIHCENESLINQLAQKTEMDYSHYQNEDGIFYYINFF